LFNKRSDKKRGKLVVSGKEEIVERRKMKGRNGF